MGGSTQTDNLTVLPDDGDVSIRVQSTVHRHQREVSRPEITPSLRRLKPFITRQSVRQIRASNPTSLGSRPAARAASSMRARSAATVWFGRSPSWYLGNQPSPNRPARSKAAGTYPPIQTGMGRCTGSGFNPASGIWCHSPLMSTISLVQSARSTSICSSIRRPRSLKFWFRATYSTSFHPTCARHGAQRHDWRCQPEGESRPGSDLRVKVPWRP